jgi:ribonuclease D
MPPDSGPLVVADERALSQVIESAAAASRLAVDIEASGMFAYHARPCTVQLAWGEPAQVAVVDTLATPIAPLGALLGPRGPVKIVHDVGFDARLLGEAGIELGNVHDTALAARMLGRMATGLASLLDAELGIHVSKTLQHHDWRIRPFDERLLAYLATDVLTSKASRTNSGPRSPRSGSRTRSSKKRGIASRRRLPRRALPRSRLTRASRAPAGWRHANSPRSA